MAEEPTSTQGQSTDLTVLNDLLQEVDEDEAAAFEDTFDGGDEYNDTEALQHDVSPDDIFHQLDTVTLSFEADGEVEENSEQEEATTEHMENIMTSFENEVDKSLTEQATDTPDDTACITTTIDESNEVDGKGTASFDAHDTTEEKENDIVSNQNNTALSELEDERNVLQYDPKEDTGNGDDALIQENVHSESNIDNENYDFTTAESIGETIEKDITFGTSQETADDAFTSTEAEADDGMVLEVETGALETGNTAIDTIVDQTDSRSVATEPVANTSASENPSEEPVLLPSHMILSQSHEDETKEVLEAAIESVERLAHTSIEHDSANVSDEKQDHNASQAEQDAWVSVELNDNTAPIFPPPAPAALPITTGTMNPTNDDDDDADSDESEDEEEQSSLPPPLNLDKAVMSDDEEDELEVDAAVVQSIELEKSKRENFESTIEDTSITQKEVNLLPEHTKSSTLASIDPAEGIDLSFGDEIRVANVVMPPSTIVSPSHSELISLQSKMNDGNIRSSTIDAFDITYTNMKTKRTETSHEDDTNENYALAIGPSFPDEREFENELNMATDVSFSVKAPTEVDDAKDMPIEDEFNNVEPESDSKDMITVNFDESRLAMLEAQRVREEEALLSELKQATCEERRWSSNASAEEKYDNNVGKDSEDGSNAMSLRELHGIYKRGLGDQSVLLLDDHDNSTEPSQLQVEPLPVMGKILSKDSVMNQAISEEDEEYGDEDDSCHPLHGQKREMLTDYTVAHENGDSFCPEDEWKELDLNTQIISESQGVPSSPNNTIDTTKPGSAMHSAGTTPSTILYQDAASYFASADVFMIQRDKIISEDFSNAPITCFSCFSRPRLLFPGAIEERDRVFCIAATGFDPHNDVFVRVLQTIYKKLTKTKRDVPLIGSHWEEIGFQGSDPSMDLRGCGVLSLFQLLHLVESHLELARRFHSLSQHPVRHFPLACTLINVTLQCIVALRSGGLYKECNKQSSIFNGINRFFVALSYQLMSEIQTSGDEIPIVMKKTLEYGRNHPDKVIDKVFNKNSSALSSVSAFRQGAGSRESSTNVAFTEIALHSTGED